MQESKQYFGQPIGQHPTPNITTMRLYNAQSCTPMATTTLRLTPSFPPQEFLPVSRNGTLRTIRITRRDMQCGISNRYQPGSREGREDQETRQDCREGSVERDSVAPVSFPDGFEASGRQPSPSKREADANKGSFVQSDLGFNAIPETSPAVESERLAGTCFLSFPKKPTAIKAKKRNSAFHSPLRIAKYSFHSPPPRSERTLSTDSTLDLVFSPGESPQLSKNETGTTAATSEIGQAKSDASESFLFDIEVVKSDSGTPAKMLETGSVISKSSSSTLTTTFAAIRRSAFAKDSEEKPFDELALDRHDDTRTLFSPIPWTSMHHQEGKPVPVKVAMQKIPAVGPIWPELQKDKATPEKSIFETAWLEDKFAADTSISESGSWIDFTNDPFQSHASSALQRPCPNKFDETRKEYPNTLSNQNTGVDGFVLKEISEKQTMDHFARRLSESGVSEISFPSITHGGNTWSQVDSVDEQDAEPRASRHPVPLRPPSVTQCSLSSRKKPSQLLGSILQARFEANRKTRQNVSNVPKTVSKLVPKQSMRMTPNKPPLRPTLRNTKIEPPKRLERHTPADPTAPSIEIAKYVKMLGMGIPADAVKNAMARDGVDIGLLFRADMIPTAYEETTKAKPATELRHFRIHWQPHSEVGTNTLWSKLQHDGIWMKETIRVDENEFSVLFRQERMTPAPPLRNTTVESSLVRVIDPKRANIGGIALSQIKLSYEHTAQAIDRMDCTALSMDQMKAILPYIPNSEEAVKLRQCLRTAATADWFRCECERFMVAMLRVSDAEEKLQHMIFMNGFADVLENLKKGKHVGDHLMVALRTVSKCFLMYPQTQYFFRGRARKSCHRTTFVASSL
eukprot:scaffold36476_cov252-Amphora_coffeaeformis.AAC.1